MTRRAIHRMFTGVHIDLSRIVAEVPPSVCHIQGGTGSFGFHFQLMDSPTVWTYRWDRLEEFGMDPPPKMPDDAAGGTRWELERTREAHVHRFLTEALEPTMAAWREFREWELGQ